MRRAVATSYSRGCGGWESEVVKPEIEQGETEIIFHHLYEAGASHEKKVRTVATPRVPQRNAPGGLRDVTGYAAWELGAVAAAEDERLFQSED